MSTETIIFTCLFASLMVNIQVLYFVTKLTDKINALLLRARAIEAVKEKP